MPSAQARLRRLRKVASRRVVVAALTAATAGVGVGLAPVAQAALPLPRSAFANPTSIDEFEPYVPQVSCDYRAKPGTVALRALMMTTYHAGADYGILNTCAAEGMTSEHADGRAWDWGLDYRIPAQRRVAMRVLNWLTANGPDGQPAYNMRRLGIMYMIYNHRIYGQYAASAGWRPYTHCSGATACHVNHIHFSLTWNGAEMRTSWWTGHATPPDYGPCQWWQEVPAPRYTNPRWTPCPAPKPLTVLTGSPRLAVGAHGTYVYLAQLLLRIPMNGRFDGAMWRAVRDFRVAHHLPANGVITTWVWKALRAPLTPKPEPTPPTPTPTPTSTPTSTPTPTPTPTQTTTDS